VSDATPVLADAGFVPEMTTRLIPERAEALAVALDVDMSVLADEALPNLWHWAYFVAHHPASELGDDGHPRRRPELGAFPARMWAGSRIERRRPLRTDSSVATRTSDLAGAERKNGASGTFWLLTIEHRIVQHGQACVLESQDIILREASTPSVPGAPIATPPSAEWLEKRLADPVQLFRFSAATSNSHRIHYDWPYATRVEGYPDLVVHGPLTAMLLADLDYRRTRRHARSLHIRARAPLFANRQFWLTGRHADGGSELAAIRDDLTVAMTLTARH
jgi:3-methylfumaryl-CoA hydratase